MKTLIEKSIILSHIGRPDAKTIFNIEDEIEKTDKLYKSIDKISGRTLAARFKYIEDNTEIFKSILIDVPANLDELAIKEYIINKINEDLKS